MKNIPVEDKKDIVVIIINKHLSRSDMVETFLADQNRFFFYKDPGCVTIKKEFDAINLIV